MQKNAKYQYLIFFLNGDSPPGGRANPSAIAHRNIVAWTDVIRRLDSIRVRDTSSRARPAASSKRRMVLLDSLQGMGKTNVLDLPADYEQLEQLWERFRALAARYPSIPHCYYERHNDGTLRFEFSRDVLPHISALGDADRMAESLAAELVLECAKERKLDRIQQCNCGRWFFAGRKDKKSCDAGCRHKRYEQTEAFKKRRPKYMHWRYAMNASKKWASIPERRRPTFEQWKQHDEPTPAEWLAIVQRQKKGA